MKKKINDALLLNLGHGVIDKMDSGKDADEMKALRLMLREVVGGKKKVLKPSKRIAKLGEESDFEAETELSIVSGTVQDEDSSGEDL